MADEIQDNEVLSRLELLASKKRERIAAAQERNSLTQRLAIIQEAKAIEGLSPETLATLDAAESEVETQIASLNTEIGFLLHYDQAAIKGQALYSALGPSGQGIPASALVELLDALGTSA